MASKNKAKRMSPFSLLSRSTFDVTVVNIAKMIPVTI